MIIAIFARVPEEREVLRAGLTGHELCIVDASPEEWVAARVRPGVEVLSVYTSNPVSARVLDRLPDLRLIATRSTGFDHIDRDAAAARDIAVCHVPDYGTATVAEFTFALILALSRRLSEADRRAARGDFPPGGLCGFDLAGRTLGVIGAGRIGRHTIQIAKGFGMEAVAYDPAPLSGEAIRLGYAYVSREELLARADIVSLHAPLNDSTRGMIDAAALAHMKPSALLINTARGPLVDTDAMLSALDAGRLAGAGLDVLMDEERLPEFGATLLQNRPNLILTPHMAYHTGEAVRRILETTIVNIRGFAAGQPRNIVPPP